MGAFSATTGHTLPDRYIEGTCPICGFESARGDQCDNCGNQLDPIDLKNPRSKIDGTTPVFKETNHLFLDLPAFADRLTEWIEKQGHWRTNVRNFSLGLLKDVKPRPITRDLDWGVPIPVPPEYAERDDKRIYVWFDAVIGYLSAAVEWAANRGTPDAWRDWWQHPDARHLYFMGKDNIVFHTVIWPSILLGYGTGGDVGAGKPLDAPARHRRERVPDDGGQAVQRQQGRLDRRRRLPQPLRPGPTALLPDRGGPGDPGQRLHMVRVRPSKQRRARRQLGQPRQPDADGGAQELRRGSRAGRAAGGRPGAARRTSRRASTRSASRSSRRATRLRSPRR